MIKGRKAEEKMTEQIKNVLERLKANNINALYFESGAEAVKYLEGELKRGAVISAGGSMTVAESGIRELITNGDYVFLDRNRPGITPDETAEVYKNTVIADYYFCSANAITEKGEIVNVDGMGNRLSSVVFGPKQVIIAAGVNKIVKDINAAFLRIKTIAAPKNAVRLSLNTPCAKTGRCVSLLKSDNPDITDGCDSDARICRQYLITGRQKTIGRVTVLLINEELGY